MNIFQALLRMMKITLKFEMEALLPTMLHHCSDEKCAARWQGQWYYQQRRAEEIQSQPLGCASREGNSGPPAVSYTTCHLRALLFGLERRLIG